MTVPSNVESVEILPGLPQEETGWEIHAIDPWDGETIRAVFPGWTEMSFQRAVSECGTGTLVVPLTDQRLYKAMHNGKPLWKTNVMFRVLDEGVVRHEWFPEKVARPEDRPGLLQFSGRGSAMLLEGGIVVPDGYPIGNATTRPYVAASRLGTWVTLFNEAQARGVAPYVRLTFDETVDTGALAWDDIDTFDVNVGDNLLDLLDQFCALGGYSWVMYPGFTLAVWKTYGSDLSETVIWHLGGHQETHNLEIDRGDIATIVYAGTDGEVSHAADSVAQIEWGVVEHWVDSGDTTDSSSIAKYAQQNLVILAEQKEARTFTVPWKAPNRRAFVDWKEGDTIGLETSDDVVEPIPIAAVTLKVDANAQTTVEIVVSEAPEPPKPKSVKRVEQEKRDGDRKTKTKASKKKKAASTGDVSSGVSSGIAASSIDALSDVSTTGAGNGDTLVFNGTNWVDVPYLLSTLGDVNLTSPATGAFLRWDGTDWIDSGAALDDLSDVVTAGASSGDVLTWDGTQWEPQAPTGGGGGGWTQVLDLPMNGSLSDITGVSGTWVTGTGCIQQTDTGASQRRARTTTKYGGGVTCVQVEARFDSGSGLRRFGLGLGGGGSNSVVAFVTGDGSTAWTMSSEQDSVVEWGNGDSVTYTGGDWITLRIITTGSSVSYFANGTWIGSGQGTISGSKVYPFLYTYQAAASFRNLKVWMLDGP